MKDNVPESREVREHRVRESFNTATKRIAELEQKLIRRIIGEERYQRAEEKNEIGLGIIDSLSDEEFHAMRRQQQEEFERGEAGKIDPDEDAVLRAHEFVHKEAKDLVGDFHGFMYSGAQEGRLSFSRAVSTAEGAGIQHVVFSAHEGGIEQTDKSSVVGTAAPEAPPDIPAEEALAAAELVRRRFEELDAFSEQDLRDLAGGT